MWYNNAELEDKDHITFLKLPEFLWSELSGLPVRGVFLF